MNKKIVLTSVAAAVLLGSGGLYFALDQQRKSVEAGVQSSIQDLIKGVSANLSKESKFDVNYESGILGSKGVVSLTENNVNVFTAKYNIDNNFNSLINGMYNVTGDLNVGMDAKKYLAFKGNFMDLTGVVNKNGDFKVALKKDTLDFNSEYAPTEKPEVFGTVKNTALIIDYKKAKKTIDMNLAFDALNGQSSALSFDLAKFEVSSLINVQNKNIGKLNLNVGNVNFPVVSLSGVKLFAEISQKNEFYDLKTEMGVKNIALKDKGMKAFLPKDNYFLNVNYSINHIHKDLFEAYVKMYEDIVNKQGNEEEMKKVIESIDFKPQFKKALANALEIKVDDISFGFGEDKVAIGASIKTPTIDEAELSMEKHALFKVSLGLSGAFADLGQMLASSLLSAEELQAMAAKKDLKLEGVYEGGELKVNGNLQGEANNATNSIKEFLRKIDGELGLKNEYLEQVKAMELLQKQLEPMSEAERMLTQPSASNNTSPAMPSISTVPLMGVPSPAPVVAK